MNLRDFLPSFSQKPAAAPLAPLTTEHRDRAKLFDLYWHYYRGQHRPTLKVKAGQPDDNVTLNWSKKVVNTGTAFLFGKPVVFEIDGGKERNPAEQYLDDVWQDDPATGFVQSVFLKSLAQNGGVCGTAFVRLYPAVEGGKPRLVNLDPAIVDVVTNPDDITDVTAYHLVWQSADKRWKRHRIERTEAGQWEIAEELYEAENRWELVDNPTPWLYDFAPIFHCQNLILANSIWGMSDLEDADLNDAINFAGSNINRILRFHAHPRTIGTGFNANQLQTTAVDQFWAIPAAEAKVFNLEMGSDLASSRQHKADLEEAYHQVTDIPRLDPAQVNLGALSGFALKILYGPLLTKTEDKRGTYGGMLQRINRALLILGGFGDLTVENKWQSPLPSATQERAQEAATLAGAGANLRAALEVAGYTAEEADQLAATRTLPQDSLIAPFMGVLNGGQMRPEEMMGNGQPA